MPLSNQELRKAGLKVTLPRLKILELLERSELRHMSAEDVYKALLDQGEENSRTNSIMRGSLSFIAS